MSTITTRDSDHFDFPVDVEQIRTKLRANGEDSIVRPFHATLTYEAGVLVYVGVSWQRVTLQSVTGDVDRYSSVGAVGVVTAMSPFSTLPPEVRALVRPGSLT